MLSNSASLFIEKRTPAMVAGVCFFSCAVLKSGIVAFFVDMGLSLPQLYTAIFGWASIMTGFLFGVYSLIISKTDGFINDAKDTQPMRQFLHYITRATVMGFILTIYGMILLVSNIEMKDISNIMFLVGTAYFALFIYSFLATVRVAYIFSIVVRVKSKVTLPG